MKLRAYEKGDSPIIATWLRTEEELYRLEDGIFHNLLDLQNKSLSLNASF